MGEDNRRLLKTFLCINSSKSIETLTHLPPWPSDTLSLPSVNFNFRRYDHKRTNNHDHDDYSTGYLQYVDMCSIHAVIYINEDIHWILSRLWPPIFFLFPSIIINRNWEWFLSGSLHRSQDELCKTELISRFIEWKKVKEAKGINWFDFYHRFCRNIPPLFRATGCDSVIECMYLWFIYLS